MAEENTVQIGSIVKLNSGSPHMTVIAIRDTDVKCTWFHDGDFKSAMFLKASLTLVN